jgi:hypothetical protein
MASNNDKKSRSFTDQTSRLGAIRREVQRDFAEMQKENALVRKMKKGSVSADKTNSKVKVDNYGNVLEDSYGEVSRNSKGYVILGKDGYIRDALGNIVKGVQGRPLKARIPYAPTDTAKNSLIKKRIAQDEAYLRPDGTVDYDKYGVVKRNSDGIVILGADNIFRDQNGFALFDSNGIVLEKPKNVRYIGVSDILVENLPKIAKGVKKTSSPKKPSNYTKDDTVLMNHLLNIKIPNGYYPQQDLTIKDLLDPSKNLVPDYTKILLNLAPKFFLRNSPVSRVILNVVALVLSDTIPYPELKSKLSNEILKVLSGARQQASVLFAKFVLTRFKDHPETLRFLRAFPFIKIVPVILAAFTIYGGVKKNLRGSLDSSISLFFSEGLVPLKLDKNEVVTRKFLEDNKVISKGDTVVNLKNLGLFNTDTVRDNIQKGISLKKVLTFFYGSNLTVTLEVTNPYIGVRTESITQIELVKNSGDVKVIAKNIDFKVSRILNKLSENVSHFENILHDINTYKTIRDTVQTLEQAEKIISEASKSPQKYSQEVVGSLKKQVESRGKTVDDLIQKLKYISIKNKVEDIAKNSDILNYHTIDFSNKLVDILNFLKSRETALISLRKEITKANTDNINIIKIICDNTITEIEASIPKISELAAKTDIRSIFEKINNFDTRKIRIL